MRLNLQKYQQNISLLHEKKIKTDDLHALKYPTSATYALKRRLIAPKWWVEGILFALGKKHAWYSSFVSNQLDKNMYEYFKVTTKNVFFMFFLWNELAQHIFNPENSKSKIKINIRKFLLGTQKQNESILKNIEENLIKPIKIFNAVKSDETSNITLKTNGYINIFRKVSLEEDANGIWLTINFAQKLSNLFASPDIKSKNDSIQNSFVTINPNLFYTMGSRVNLKNALNGLFLEYSKQEEPLDSDYTAFNIDGNELESFHKIVSSTANGLYEHGMLGRSASPPMMKISEIRKRQEAAGENGSLVFAWRLSTQTKEAHYFEDTLSQQLNHLRKEKLKPKLFHEPPQDELQKVRESHPKPQTVESAVPIVTNEIKPPAPAIKNETVFKAENPQPCSYVPPKQPNFHAFSERELSIFVTRFYESLNQKQKKMFENERQSMTKEQFRSFMIPILQRTHTTLIS